MREMGLSDRPLEFEPSPSDPDVFLALSLSITADENASISSQFSIDVDNDAVHVRIPRAAPGERKTVRLLGSKETIAFALLLRRLLVSGQKRYEDRLNRTLSEYAVECYQQGIENRTQLLFPQANTRSLLQMLDVHSQLIHQIDDLTGRVFDFLENEGFVVDPGITATTGIAVLLGLVPVRWSVRTPKGQQVYREIKVRAGLWTLDVQKRRRGSKKITDWDFNFRGVRTVRRLLKTFAQQYLEYEYQDRNRRGKPTLPAPDDVDID